MLIIIQQLKDRSITVFFFYFKTMKTKVCTKCKNKKDIALFYVSKGNVSSMCKSCFISLYKPKKIISEIIYLENELFKAIDECNFLYEVSTFGRVKSINYNNTNSPKILKNNTQKTGYFSVGIKINNKRYTVSVHRLVAIAFIPNPENKPYVNHINGIKTDNRVENLEWSTAKENTDHGIRLGLISDIKGNLNRFSVLSEIDVLEIRETHKNTKQKYSQTAKKYNVSSENISLIVNRKTWKHI